MLHDDVARDAETQAAALRLGRELGCEQAVAMILVDAATRVGDFDLDRVVPAARAD